MQLLKTCSRCKEQKPAISQYFYKEKRNKDGFQYQCKACKRKIDNSYRTISQKPAEYQKSPSFVFAQLKYQAKKKNINFTLDKDYYLYHLANKPCFYCGTPKTNHIINMYINDHTVGYTKENSVPCCEFCNKMKSHYNPNEFLKHCHKVIKHNL